MQAEVYRLSGVLKTDQEVKQFYGSFFGDYKKKHFCEPWQCGQFRALLSRPVYMTDCAGRQGPPKVKYDDYDTVAGQCCQRAAKFPRQHHKPWLQQPSAFFKESVT